ncbi:hypothetical protein ACFO1B_14965 [Dactylosporangium siamense]|uniref:Uncharacterized protein n=1 Tax=Dactylosporangium siamense TaxID=685454 RepID=A0A919PJK8_9ACTN|nr:hypothetical protein [Dactylosporangium siamense]GIG45134.1 hypothetical protein Dsi01nite_031750 [Dactylosporangium siamense]
MLIDMGGTLVEVSKAVAADFTPWHEEQLAAMTYADRLLHFPDPRWRCAYLGKGEEKAAFRVCDHRQRVFVVEVIDERTYLNGRFVTGTYFLERRVVGLSGVAFDRRALIGLRFTGLVKVREFVDGYEWARFQWRPDRPTWLDHPMTAFLRLVYGGRFDTYRRRYRDVHERNVLFEVRGPRQPGVPVLARDAAGRVRLARVGLQPIDLR